MKTKDLRKKTEEDLKQALAERREKLQELRILLSSGKLKDIRDLREAKKDIAKILTLINELSKK